MDGVWAQWMNRAVEGAGSQLDDAHFFSQLYFMLENDRAEGSPLYEILSRPHLRLSAQLDRIPLQDSALARSRIRSRELAIALIDEKGNWNEGVLKKSTDILRDHLYTLGPNRHFDTHSQAHLYRCLTWLHNEQLQKQIIGVDAPWDNQYLQQLIRDTLVLSPTEKIDAAATRRALLSAWFHPLRQNIGSCFATAPAIMIQAEQPGRFFADLKELLSVGQLTRTFGGIRYTVPLCVSWGYGDLLRPIPLSDVHGLSESPGIQLALEAAGLVEMRVSEKIRIQQIQAWLSRVIPLLQGPVTNAEIVIRTILLVDGGLELADLEFQAYEQQSIDSHWELMMPFRESASQFQRFRLRFSRAKEVFKAITDHPLLKTWEFTLASFSDVKSNFSRRNLYISLGLDPEEPNGIGQAIVRFLQDRLDRAKLELDELNSRYEVAYSLVRSLEERLRQAGEAEVDWLRSEHYQRAGVLQSIHTEREILAVKGERLAHLLKDLVELYTRLFPDYFQEVYDPDMHDLAVRVFDDSPAGFRLLYKHGRINPSVWTMIYTSSQFLQSLRDFFMATEGTLQVEHGFSLIKAEISDVVTEIIAHTRTHAFLESALNRSAQRHGISPLINSPHNLEPAAVTPWSYISGGTMTTLVSAYFGLEEGPTVVSRVVEDPLDLLVFLIDALKEMPAADTHHFLEDPLASMLIQSPTHGFLLKPGFSPFCHSWTDRGNTSTWIRDHLIRPSQAFIESLVLDHSHMRLLLDAFVQGLPHTVRVRLSHRFRRFSLSQASVREFRAIVCDELVPGGEEDLHSLSLIARFDSLLFGCLPFISEKKIESELANLLETLLSGEALERARIAYQRARGRGMAPRPVNASEFQNMAQSLILLGDGSTTSPIDRTFEVRTAMRRQGLALPAPLLIADTNWNREFFAFAVNPGTGELDFWRTDYLGLSGVPMVEWYQWFQGAQNVPWMLYTRPHEYTSPQMS